MKLFIDFCGDETTQWARHQQYYLCQPCSEFCNLSNSRYNTEKIMQWCMKYFIWRVCTAFQHGRWIKGHPLFIDDANILIRTVQTHMRIVGKSRHLKLFTIWSFLLHLWIMVLLFPSLIHQRQICFLLLFEFWIMDGIWNCVLNGRYSEEVMSKDRGFPKMMHFLWFWKHLIGFRLCISVNSGSFSRVSHFFKMEGIGFKPLW